MLVHGTGPIGIMAVRISKACGAAKVIVTGRQRSKLAVACSMGADWAIDTTREKVADAVHAYFGPKGADCAIEASGSLELLRDSVHLVRPGGTIALLAFYDSAIDRFDIDSLILSNITLKPVPGGLHAMIPVLRMMERGLLDFRPLITGRYSLTDAVRAVEDTDRLHQTRIKLMLDIHPGP